MKHEVSSILFKVCLSLMHFGDFSTLGRGALPSACSTQLEEREILEMCPRPALPCKQSRS